MQRKLLYNYEEAVHSVGGEGDKKPLHTGRKVEVKGQMHGTLEQLRDRFPGKWLLIQLDDSEAEEGTVLAAHEDPDVVDRELEKHFQPNMSRHKPLYVTYSLPEGQDLPAVAL